MIWAGEDVGARSRLFPEGFREQAGSVARDAVVDANDDTHARTQTSPDATYVSKVQLSHIQKRSFLMDDLWDLGMPWQEFLLRAVVVYVVCLCMTRLTGKRSVGQNTPFDILVIVLLGTAVQNSLIGDDTSLLGGLILAATLLGLNWLVGAVGARSRRIDRIVQGCPTVLARDGVVDWRELVRRNVSYADFEVSKRAADCRSDDEIELALLETSGSITVLKKRR